MRAALIAVLLLSLAACGKKEEESPPPKIERISDALQTCWRINGGPWSTTAWTCEKKTAPEQQ